MSNATSVTLICDVCGHRLGDLSAGYCRQLPFPWKGFEVASVVGQFHVCSAVCEAQLRIRFCGLEPSVSWGVLEEEPENGAGEL